MEQWLKFLAFEENLSQLCKLAPSSVSMKVFKWIFSLSEVKNY